MCSSLCLHSGHCVHRSIAAKFVMSGLGTATAPPLIALSYMCAWCAGVPTTKPLLALSASFRFLLAVLTNLLEFDYLSPPLTPTQLFPLSAYTNRLDCAHCPPLINPIFAGGAIFYLTTNNGVSIIKISPWLNDCLFLSTDACNTGDGGYFTGLHFHTPFPDAILYCYGHDINILELLTVMVALKLWGALLCGRRITFQCDNINSVLAINSGHSRVPGMQLCLWEIWFLTARHYIDICAKHIPGLENSIADHLSRWHLSPSHQQRFAELTAGFPTTYIFCPTQLFDFEIDL